MQFIHVFIVYTIYAIYFGFIFQSCNLDQIVAPNYQTTGARDRPGEIRTHDRLIENLKAANTEQLIENAVNESKRTEYKFTVGEKVLFSNGRKRPLDLSSSESYFTGPFVVTEVKPKVKIMSIKDFTQTKCVTELSRLVPYEDVYKLAIFESPTDDRDGELPAPSIPIVDCDDSFNVHMEETVIS